MPLDPRILHRLNAHGAKLVLVMQLPIADSDGPSMMIDPGDGDVPVDEIANGIGLAISGLMTLARQVAETSKNPAEFLAHVMIGSLTKPVEVHQEMREMAVPKRL